MRNPTISVLLPIFNSREFLYESINSILIQTYSDFELLILDDGSTDNPKLVIDEFQDDRLRYFRSSQNKGIVYQLNKGLNLSTGKYIARMDADDIAHPDRFNKQIDYFTNPRNIEIEVLGTNAEKVGFETGRLDFHNYLPRQISFLLNFYCPILHPTVMFKRTIIEKGFKYSEDYQYAEDFALWKEVNNGRNIAILPLNLLQYRIHEKQTNKSSVRLNIQKNSCYKIMNLPIINFVDRFFITRSIRKHAVELWFGVESVPIKGNIISRYYLLIRKKMLKIKSGLLNSLIGR